LYKFLRFISFFMLLFIVAGAGFTAGMLYKDPRGFALLPVTGARPTTTASQPQELDQDLIQQAYEIIQKNYADRATLNETSMTYSAISGMVDSLGDTGHSRFLTPEMVKSERRAIQGEFEGIGALLQTKDGRPVILAPLDNSPAQKAGLRAGDMILEVNGEDVSTASLTQIVERVLGPAGTKVTIKIERPETGEIHTFTITRAKIEIKNVTWQMIPGTKMAHIRIAAFSQNVGRDLERAINEAKDQGMQGIILDLRNNPGGLLHEAIEVVSEFLTSGNVMQEKNAQGEIRNIPVRRGGIATQIPMVVLINEGSASAAEITAGAMQDYNRATLVGQTTFGTGTVLLNFPLADGSGILLATEMWLTPKGRVIWHTGIEPDIAVELDAEVTPSIPETERDLTVEGLKTLKDTQLLRAIEELQKKIR
jgi:carboxyl-terminal processing protease